MICLNAIPNSRIVLMKSFYGYFLFVFIVVVGCFETQAQQKTQVMVRAKAKDAKFIGSSIGGAQILIKNAQTQEVMAEGVTNGSTGNTTTIMKEPHQRRTRISDDETGGFLAKFNLDQPTFVTIEAYAPKNAASAAVRASTQLWLIPGKDILGDGIVLEIPGFIVDILSPQRHKSFAGDKSVKIKANITMTCGCPIAKDSIWDANDYEVKALLYKDGQRVEEKVLDLEKTSTFAGEVNLSAGMYELIIYAYDPDTGNTGVDKTNFLVD